MREEMCCHPILTKKLTALANIYVLETFVLLKSYVVQVAHYLTDVLGNLCLLSSKQFSECLTLEEGSDRLCRSVSY
jgi:hypothetical protein